MNLAAQFNHEGLAVAAPQADGKSWFPYSFLVPVGQNEPGIPSALIVISSLVTEATLLGVPQNKVMIFGFSQGACLALEFAARNPARYGAIFALSGGLIGPPGTTWESEENLSGTPTFIGCSDVDPHIPRSRLEESREVLTQLGADVTLKLYPGMGHTISGAELEQVNAIIAKVMAEPLDLDMPESQSSAGALPPQSRTR